MIYKSRDNITDIAVRYSCLNLAQLAYVNVWFDDELGLVCGIIIDKYQTVDNSNITNNNTLN